MKKIRGVEIEPNAPQAAPLLSAKPWATMGGFDRKGRTNKLGKKNEKDLELCSEQSTFVQKGGVRRRKKKKGAPQRRK